MSNILLNRFKKDIKYITHHYRELVERTKRSEIVGNINEWIIDNYYIIKEQYKCICNEFDDKKIKEIKRTRKDYLYNFVLSYLKENDFKFNIDSLIKELNEYQVKKKDYFSYIEINFIYLMIKVVLISELSNLSHVFNDNLKQKDEVNNLFNLIYQKIQNQKEINLENYVSIKKLNNKSAYYIEQLNYHLKEEKAFFSTVFPQLNEMLSKNGKSLKELVKKSQNQTIYSNLLIANVFISFIDVLKYTDKYLYENASYTEKVLMSENANIYSQLCDASKSIYRMELSKNAIKRNMSEYTFSSYIVNRANEEKKHVGWHLFKQVNSEKRFTLFLTSIVLFTLLLSFLISYKFNIWLFILSLIPVSNLVVEIVSNIIGRFTKPSKLLGITFENGLPKEYSTMVVIPTIVKDTKKVYSVFDKLELYYLSNKTDNLYFTLLADCSSEKEKDIDADKHIIEAGLEKTRQLNEKYGKKLFYFVYRNRMYSDSEECYLGFERKRGALNHFNKLLLNKLTEEEKKQYFNCHTFNNFDISIKYVITLDVDTKLVLNAALKLIGTMAHPLNKPVVSSSKKVVTSGYGIMQPRVSYDIEATLKSDYAKTFADLGGLDVYSANYFNLYQDLFKEGCFFGKGIYDLNVFEEVLGERFPNNLILSHDLLEGNYLRCGYINDVELFDDFPDNYLNDSKRHHRWNRGDWQIISWLKRKVKNEKGKTVSNPLEKLSKWKIFDNLRRSLVNILVLLIILFGFIIDVKNTNYYVSLVLIIIMLPMLVSIFPRILNKKKNEFVLEDWSHLSKSFISIINKSFIMLSILPYEAYLYLDSTIRSLYRMYISKKKLLNWITAEEVSKTLKNNFISYLKAFKINYLMALLLIISAYFLNNNNLIMASLFALMWLFAPVLMYILSSTKELKERRQLSNTEEDELKEIADKTWKFFDEHLTEENNYLIPDNYQCNRYITSDYKTSSTNIGLSLVSVISAYELGLISINYAVSLLRNVIYTVERLEKWNGHLYNWYNIRTLQKLHPDFVSTIDSGNFIASLYIVKSFLEKHGDGNIVYHVTKLIEETDFKKLYDIRSDLFSIGYNASEQELLKNNYNNLASEVRLTSYIAIAKRDVSYKHWFKLGRTIKKYKTYKGIASWYGSCFEYFMPLIFMKNYKHTLLDETYNYAYNAQKDFIKQIDPELPWGISETAYSELDDSENYKYGPFGIPYLKLQDSIDYPIIISSYSSVMAIDINAVEIYNNIQKLKRLGMYGDYGLYESYDYEAKTVVKSYFAHHQAMILASLTNCLKKDIIKEYFHYNKQIQAVEMILREKPQLNICTNLKMDKYRRIQYKKENEENDARECIPSSNETPEIGLLSNGEYTLFINDRGTGFSKYKDLYMNRYRQVTTENQGVFLYIRNLNNNKVWSNTYAPINDNTIKYKTTFLSDHVKYNCDNEGLIANTELVVTKDHSAELRRVTFINKTTEDIELEVTSYGEVTMTRMNQDLAHRAFYSLTIKSEFDNETKSLIFHRKSHSRDNAKYFLIHRMFLEKDNNYIKYETSRLAFIGRNRDLKNPDVISHNKELTNTVGAVIDPIMSIRKRFIVKANETETLYMLVGFGKSREQVYEIGNIYKDKNSIDKAFSMTKVFNKMRNSYNNLKASQMFLYYKILKYIYQSTPISDSRKELISNNNLTQSNLWKFGISGDLPIIVVKISKLSDIGFIQKILQAFEFYKDRSLYIDIVIITDEENGKEKLLQDSISVMINQINYLNNFMSFPGNVFVISNSKLSDDEKGLLNKVARMSFDASIDDSMEEQIYNLEKELSINSSLQVSKETLSVRSTLPEDIEFSNNFGGFIANGKEYYIERTDTPLPWSNVIANSHFGFVVTNNFGGFTYAYNSREFKITSWSNDMVEDPRSENIIVNGTEFNISHVKHGFGYSIFYGGTDNYDISVKVFVSIKDSVKFYELSINNKTDKNQKLKIDLALNLVLGVTEEDTNRYLNCHFNKKENSLYIKNSYIKDFKDTQVFVTSTEKISDYSIEDVVYKTVSVNVDIDSNDSKKFSFILGCGNNQDTKINYNNQLVEEEYRNALDYWEKKLNVITVYTPDTSLNHMLNGWYLYQAYSSRLIAKTGLYQVGGATGFRDQLQDVMGIIYSDKEYARKQILKHAMHQFKEGDVLHWWHEETKFGSRTRVSDDYLWLVYVTFEYIKITEDKDILNESICYVAGESLASNEMEKGIIYNYSIEKDTLYNHLKAAINHATAKWGKHGLPLMGSGDWNDGMNRVGSEGIGESVFVGFFLYDLLYKMSNMSKILNDTSFESYCINKRTELYNSLINNSWDGEWYLRAYYDNGMALGSRNNLECQIDLLCQAWSVLSDVATKTQRKSLFESVETKLVNKKEQFIQLLKPAFMTTNNNPGYIKSYPPGVRENGGQYTHAALWYILALLKDNQISKAYEYYQMINPINHTLDEISVQKYKVEPYVIAADIYTNKENTGRGGWTWYTGSASWAYKIGIEEIIGFKREGSKLRIDPKIDKSWNSFSIVYRYFDTLYDILVLNEHHVNSGIKSVILDGNIINDNVILLENDKSVHKIIINMKEE